MANVVAGARRPPRSVRASNTDQYLLQVALAFRRGDLEVRLAPEMGVPPAVAEAFNQGLEACQHLVGELERLSRRVGKEGDTGQRATPQNGATGAWQEATGNLNSLISDLVQPSSEVARVIASVAHGDLSQTMELEVDGRPLRGEFRRAAEVVNTMVGQLNRFVGEVTRVAREVGTEGKLGGQAQVLGMGGAWKDLTESVNSMASNLTAQVRNIAGVTTAVAKGDLSTKITVDARGEILELKNTVNTMVDQLNAFAGEVTRVAREVGTEGKLGGQAQVVGVGGVWKDLTENVNSMAGSLTNQVRNIAAVTTAVARGDLSTQITVDVRGEMLELKSTINTMVDQLNAFASEVTRVAREVGTEGKLGGQAQVRGVGGVWRELTENVNSMAGNLTSQVRNIAGVTTAVARGDLSRKITVDVQGEILELKNTINTMVDQLNVFADEVTRVAREVGTEGKLGGQAQVKGVGGVWKDLTDNVNSMAANLTTQVRGIARVVTAVANGDLKRTLALEAKGEISDLAETINDMIGTLALFADQVTSVAREVGVEGKLGGQAEVPGAAGIWRNLTNNVNQLAQNLTTQVRAIAEVATAVTKGDLTRSIAVEAQGEVAALKDNINAMIGNLAETTRENTEQDWLKTNLARINGMLQGQRDLEQVARLVLTTLAPLVEARHGLFYASEAGTDRGPRLRLKANYGADQRHAAPEEFRLGEGLIGECALAGKSIITAQAPAGYIQINSGLGSAPPAQIVVLPVLFEGQVQAVIELGSFQPFNSVHLALLTQLMDSMGIMLNSIAASTRTEQLLQQSQALAGELQAQQAEMREKAGLLAEQKTQVETKNLEIEQARSALEDKARQLALTSKYKSEFLANMSHELRTPLNNLLLLAKVLSENADENLSPRQVKFAETIHASGTDLLALINDILDLSKIESGTMGIELSETSVTGLAEFVIQSFRHVAEGRGLALSSTLADDLPAHLHSDAKRLRQVLKNLVSNALKFTEHGEVSLRVAPARGGWSPGHAALDTAAVVVAFEVRDTGIGIAASQQRVIFEAFRQADGTATRKYGGTGLGLSISREIARLLGGEITVQSAPGQGSTFTLYVPQDARAAQALPTALPARVTEPVATDAADAAAAAAVDPMAATAVAGPPPDPVPADDREHLLAGDAWYLLASAEPNLARELQSEAKRRRAKFIVATSAEEAMSWARRAVGAEPGGVRGNPGTVPTVVLDLRRLPPLLPDASPWLLAERLRRDPLTQRLRLGALVPEPWRAQALRLGLAAPTGRERRDGEALAMLLDALQRVAPASAAAGGAETLAGRRVLVVDDDPRNIFTLTSALEAHGLEVAHAEGGRQALALLDAAPPGHFDLVYMDIMMPEFDGYQTIGAIRSRPAMAALPVIALTAKAMRGDRERCLAAGASDYLAKPVEMESLLALTRIWLPASERRSEEHGGGQG